MPRFEAGEIPKSPRIDRLIAHLFAKPPEVEADRAELITASYKKTEGEPIVLRRAKAFAAILEGLPVVIRPEELIVGSATRAPRGCQVFPEFSYAWLESELDTIAARTADPFAITEETKARLRAVFPYWKGKTTSELAQSYMLPETLRAMEHNLFTPGNYFYNGVGHVTVDYGKVLEDGLEGVISQAQDALRTLTPHGPRDAKKRAFLEA
ncbi:MAG TPA: pyruvate formate lyase family protein, partial [Clostridia bacterium]|nr:pyruvate formate lyase family protein [Clostridia bacterium]